MQQSGLTVALNRRTEGPDITDSFRELKIKPMFQEIPGGGTISKSTWRRISPSWGLNSEIL